MAVPFGLMALFKLQKKEDEEEDEEGARIEELRYEVHD